jgi:rhodanese-related sulfurtransferase
MSPIREISPPEAVRRQSAGATLIDVREQHEWDAGHVAGAVFIPRGVLEQEVRAAVPNLDTEIVVYCRSGARSALGTQQLQQLGYTDVVNMAGGILQW